MFSNIILYLYYTKIHTTNKKIINLIERIIKYIQYNQNYILVTKNNSFLFSMLGCIEGIIIGRSKSHKTDGIIKYD